MFLQLFLLYFCSITLLSCHNLSLSGPNLQPAVYSRGVYSPVDFLKNKPSVELLYHDDVTGKSLFADEDTLLLVDFLHWRIDLKRPLPCQNSAKAGKPERQPRAYGVLEGLGSNQQNRLRQDFDNLSQNSTKNQIHFCIFDSTSQPTLKRIDLNTFEISNQVDNWPPKYCSWNENLSPNFKVAGSPTSISTVEVWRENCLLVREFTSHGLSRKLQVKESDILQLVDTFIKAGVTFFITREKIPSVPASKSWAYVNKISRSCQENDTRMMFLKTKELRCVFTQDSEEFNFTRLLDSYYDHKSHILFGLYTTFENSNRGSALCIHYFENIEPEKCPNEATVVVKTPDRKERDDPKMPLFIRTQDPFLTKLKVEMPSSDRDKNALIYLASVDGHVLKLTMNMETLAVNLIREVVLSDFDGYVNQLELIGEKVFIGTSRQSYVLPKHACGSYCSSSDCLADYFCQWNETTELCRVATPPEAVKYMNNEKEDTTSSKCHEEPFGKAKSNNRAINISEKQYVEEIFEDENYYGFSYESLERHLKAGSFNEGLAIGSISLVAGILAGVALLHLIAYIKSTMIHSNATSSYGISYNITNYSTQLDNENQECSAMPEQNCNFSKSGAVPNGPDNHVKYITMDKGNGFQPPQADHRRSPQYASIPDGDNSVVTRSQAINSVSSYPSSSISLLSQTQNGGLTYVKCAIFDKSRRAPNNPPHRIERLNSLQEPLLSTSSPLYTFGGEQKVDVRASSKSSNISAISISELSDSVFPGSNH